MPTVEFNTLPADARVWIFASDRPLQGEESRFLLEEVDRFLTQWKAHGTPLRNAREWRDDRFLVIAVDPTVEQASGCSIDGLFRALQQLEGRLATGLVAGGRVFYRDDRGVPRFALRNDVGAVAATGQLHADSPVFDTSLTTVRDYRERFERAARVSWMAPLLGRTQASHPSSRSATNSSSERKG